MKNVLNFMVVISWGLLFGVLAACEDAVDVLESEIQQAFEDSVAQATIDDALIEAYISEAGYDNGELYPVSGSTDEGVRYFVLEGGEGDYPSVNDIVSLDYIGRFTDDVFFDTSIESFAITHDSVQWIEKWDEDARAEGNSFSNDSILVWDSDDLETTIAEDTLDISDLEMDEILQALWSADVVLDNDLPEDLIYSFSRNYAPYTYNYTPYGTGLLIVPGLEDGAQALLPLLNEGARGLIIFPSVLGYGTSGSGNVPENSVLIFELRMSSIEFQ